MPAGACNCCFYRAPKKLLEGNVFSHVCLSVYLFTGGGSHITITHDALSITTQGHSPDMFKPIEHGPHCLGIPPAPVAPYRDPPLPRTVGKRAVRILLEFFLVIIGLCFFEGL